MIIKIYSFILLPIAVFLSHLGALLYPKLKKPVFRRHKIFRLLHHWNRSADKNLKTVLIHSSSMGEFEHIKPLIKKLHDNFNVNIIVTFFSPSGYDNVKYYKGVALFTYMPFDFQWVWKKFYKLTNTVLLIISKHDVWINQIAVAKKLNITSVLVNASLTTKSSRSSFLARLMLSNAYRSLDTIFTISEKDKEQFFKSFKCSNVKVVGDTKFDQVILRKEDSVNKEIIDRDWIKKKEVVLFGSLWPDDAKFVLPGIIKIMNTNDNIRVIIAPHQPTAEIINALQIQLNGTKNMLFSAANFKDKEKILIIDKIGLLADTYKYADIAYIGGSFKQGIHNVMEPSIYGIPVIYGPIHENSYEAVQLKSLGGSIVIRNQQEFENTISELLKKPKLREQIGEKAYTFATQNTGSTERIIESLKNVLKSA